MTDMPTTKKRASTSAKKRVRSKFDLEALRKICALQDFSEYAEKHELEGKDRFYWFKDNGSHILAIAHLDSVQTENRCDYVETANGPLVFSPVLDDRLGAYVILELLPALGITVDWLLTTDEERCASTASAFVSEKQYQWMFQFDRAGKDVVMYQYDTKDMRTWVEESGAIVGRGSVSDISSLEHLGCKGMNWGVGYRDYHSIKSHAWLNDTFSMVAKFLKFYRLNKGFSLPHTKVEPKPWVGDGRGWRDSDHWKDDYRKRMANYEEWWNDQYMKRQKNLTTTPDDDELKPAVVSEDEWKEWGEPKGDQVIDDCPVCNCALNLVGICNICGQNWSDVTYNDLEGTDNPGDQLLVDPVEDVDTPPADVLEEIMTELQAESA